MPDGRLRLTYVGGPTVIVEFDGGRFLVDPTLDPAGTDYPTPAYTLRKSLGPALPPEGIGRLDAVLLSHDHHPDNLDAAGRLALAQAPVVYTTAAGASRLGGNAVGLAPWESVDVPVASGGSIRVTATPARHGPAESDRGPVIGFVLQPAADGAPALYLSGDTVWYEGVEEVGRRFRPAVALLNAGAARVAPAGPWPLTFTAAEAVTLARAWPQAVIIPLHFEGWAHFSEGRPELEQAFASAGLDARLTWLAPGRPIAIHPGERGHADS